MINGAPTPSSHPLRCLRARDHEVIFFYLGFFPYMAYLYYSLYVLSADWGWGGGVEVRADVRASSRLHEIYILCVYTYMYAPRGIISSKTRPARCTTCTIIAVSYDTVTAC